MGLDDLTSGLLGDLDLDRAKDVVEVVWEHKDELLELISTLPTVLGEVGEQMQAAGDGAQRASAFLVDDVQDLTTKAADALIDSHARLQAVSTALGGLGDLLDDLPLVGDVSGVVGEGLKGLAGVADDVEAVAGQIRGLGDRLGDVGGDLDGMGASLKGGGVTMASFSLGGGSTATKGKPKGPGKAKATGAVGGKGPRSGTRR